MQHLGALLVDPFAGDKGRPRHHVLARSVPGRIIEASEDHAVCVIALDVMQFAD